MVGRHSGWAWVKRTPCCAKRSQIRCSDPLVTIGADVGGAKRISADYNDVYGCRNGRLVGGNCFMLIQRRVRFLTTFSIIIEL